MGRSVNYHSYAQYVIYLKFDPACDMCGGCGLCWTEFKRVIVDQLRSVAPSLEFDETSAWDQNEVYMIARNGLCAIFISEYCDVVSLSFVPLFEVCALYDAEANLQTAWLARMKEKYEKAFLNRLTKVGTYSNGNSIYERCNNG